MIVLEVDITRMIALGSHPKAPRSRDEGSAISLVKSIYECMNGSCRSEQAEHGHL